MKTKQALLALLIAIVPAIAQATHVPGGGEKVVYDGPIKPGVSVTGAIGWVDPLDGYDWYCFDVAKGKKVSFAATRKSGDIKLNIGAMKGLAADGATMSSLTLIDHTNNSTAPDVTFSFTPDFDGTATIWVSTWLGENGGNYTVLMTGGIARSACGTVTGPGPTPSTSQISVIVPVDPILASNNSSTTVPVSVFTGNGFAQDVTLSVSGLPDDVTTKFSKSTLPSPGGGDVTLTITTGPLTFPATYFVTVTATSADGTQTAGSTFQFVVNCEPPMILGVSQPRSRAINRGSATQLTVSVEGTGPFVYQWYRGFKGVTSSPVANATGATLNVPAVNETTTFWVRVSNACGTADSNPAFITVQ